MPSNQSIVGADLRVHPPRGSTPGLASTNAKQYPRDCNLLSVIKASLYKINLVQWFIKWGLGNDIAEAVLAVDFPAQVLHQAQVSKGLDPADELPRLVLEQGGADRDGNFLAVGFKDGDGLADYRLAGFQGLFQDAAGFADVGPEHLTARAAQGFGGWNAGDVLCGPVEEGDPPVMVNGEDAIRATVQDGGGFGGAG